MTPLEAVAAFDIAVIAGVSALRSPAIAEVMSAVTHSADAWAITPALAILFFVLWRAGRRHDAVFAVVLVAGGMLISTVLKVWFGRSRPPLEHALLAPPATSSLPSGHTMASVCLAAAICYAVHGSSLSRGAKWTIAAASAAWVFAVSLSRVYLGVHWPSDVLASWALGSIWIAVALMVDRRITRSRGVYNGEPHRESTAV